MNSSPLPEFKKYLDPAIISRTGTLDIKARLIVEGFLLGLHKSPYHGFSIEFSQHRPYIQGDAPKDIDWKVYAKTDRFFVKQYEEETNLKCHIILDMSKSMDFSHAGRVKKFEYGSYLAAALSYLLLKQQDAAGLILYADTVKKMLPPRASQQYLKEILTSLAQAQPSGKTQTASSLHQVAEKIKRRGLIVLISDFFDDAESVKSALKHFAFNKNEVIVFQVLDPAEIEFAFGKDAIFRDMESDEEMTTQPFQIQKAYQSAMQDFLATIKRECLNNKIDYHLIDTSQPFDKALYAFLQKRSHLK